MRCEEIPLLESNPSFLSWGFLCWRNSLTPNPLLEALAISSELNGCLYGNAIFDFSRVFKKVSLHNV